MSKVEARLVSKEVLKLRWRAYQYRFLKEQLEIKSVLRHIKHGDLALDIGAYKGAYTYWMSKAVGTTGKVYAFEPQKSIHNTLSRAINAAKINNVVLEPMGLSSKSGQMRLVIPEDGKEHSPGATLEIKNDDRYQAYNVQVTTLDSYFQKLDKRKIRFIKCDAEGHELEIFHGGIEILKKYRPVLLFECEQRHLSKHKVCDVFAFLEQLGYKGRFIYKNKFYPIKEFQIERYQSANKAEYVNNFLFCGS